MASESDQPPLSYLFLNVTRGCNLRCSFCGASAGATLAEELTLKEIEAVLSEARSMGAARVLLGGGEPFLRPDFFDVLLLCHDLDISPTIETNGTFITDRIAERLKEVGVSEIGVSLDGAKPETHDRLRGVEGCFSKAIHGLNLLREAGISVGIQCLLCKSNYSEIIDLRNLAAKLEVSFRMLPRILPIGRGREVQDENVTIQSLRGLLDRLFDEERASPSISFDIGVGPALMPIDLLNKTRLCNLSESCGVTSDGWVSMCPLIADFPELRSGNVRREALTKIWSDSPLHRFIREDLPENLRGVCRLCVARETCRGGCRIHAHSVYGDLRAPDPLCQQFYDNGLFPEYALSRSRP